MPYFIVNFYVKDDCFENKILGQMLFIGYSKYQAGNVISSFYML